MLERMDIRGAATEDSERPLPLSSRRSVANFAWSALLRHQNHIHHPHFHTHVRLGGHAGTLVPRPCRGTSLVRRHYVKTSSVDVVVISKGARYAQLQVPGGAVWLGSKNQRRHDRIA